MYNKIKMPKTKMRVSDHYVGETIEQKVRRIVNNREPITDGAELVYTERKDGVQPGYDIRTDRFEIAVEAMDKVHKTEMAKREDRHKTPEQKEAERLAKEAKNNMGKENQQNDQAN